MDKAPFKAPDFTQEFLQNAPNAILEPCPADGVAPENYHALSIYPEYFKVDGEWKLAVESRMDTVAVIDKNRDVQIIEFRNLKKDDLVVIGRTEDASEGIYMYTDGFDSALTASDKFAFRSGRSRETAFSKDYDDLYAIMREEKENDGHIVWVLGPSISYDDKSRNNLAALARGGYVNAFIAGNSTAVIDLSRGLVESEGKNTTTADDEFETVRRIRELGGIEKAVKDGNIQDGFMKAFVEEEVPYILAGSIRDRYNLEEVIDNVYEAQDKMRAHTRKATMLICLSSVLNTIASGNMTPSYNEMNGEIRRVYIYSVDLQEFSVNKLSDRGTLEVKTLVTNIHDFIEHVKTALIGTDA